MALKLLSPEDYAAAGASANVALLGAPGAVYDEQRGIRHLTEEGQERAAVAAGLISRIASGKLILHPGYGAGYKKGGPRPTSYRGTEACAYETLVNVNLSLRYVLGGIRAAGWEVLPGEASDGPDDFSSSTAREAYLIDRTYRQLGGTGLLAVVGGPRQLERFADATEAMQLAIADTMVGIATSGANESGLREHLARTAYRRAVLPGEQTPESVLAREQDFFEAGVLGKVVSIALGPLHSRHSASLAQ
jgi:hypothetical protein